ncbi:tetratricopeptide repeat protein [Robertmurraya andreesenii]|uniref:Tetratricopeptide (TPR) repeat protein n=1 Tax=Anoxybacillus andreesenii TaxID=1325932 RepID=A0ABT9UYN1_9BACL|nr:hypothetical protein [Robertmurraya andreesenii]MDQ0153804.1 tetratricopeptide (TPR) repeat protein [Robertmurraya andreesenii]
MKKLFLFTSVGIILFFGVAYTINKFSDKQSNKAVALNRENNISDLVDYISNNEEDIDAKKALAWEYLTNKNYEEAIRLNKEVLNHRKNDTEALHQLVISYISTSKYEEAKSTSEELLKFNNYNPVALTNLAQVYFLLENENEFVIHIEKAIEASNIQESKDFEDQFYANLNDIKNKYLDNMRNGNPADRYFLLSQEIYLEPKLRIKALDKIIQVDPTYNKDVYIMKGKLDMQENNLEEAKLTYEALIDIYPDEEYGYFLLADILFKLSDFTSMEELLKRTRNEHIANFVNSLVLYQTNKSAAFDQLEDIYNKTLDQYKQIVLYNLVSMSKDMKNEKKYQNYLEVFNQGTFDEDYLIAISQNPRLDL